MPKAHGHNFANTFRAFAGRCLRHQLCDELMPIPAMPANMPIIGGAKPPPTRSIATERSIKIKPPFFFWTKAAAHMMRINETITFNIGFLTISPFN